MENNEPNPTQEEINATQSGEEQTEIDTPECEKCGAEMNHFSVGDESGLLCKMCGNIDMR